ncbi:DUF177 domain-containing protein [Candidatus Poribacteria bacterium]
MRIAIENIPESVSNLELTCEIEELDLESEVVRFTGRVTVKLNLFKHDDNVYIKAKSSVAVESECARCLSPVRRILEVISENQYQPVPKIPRHLMDDIGIRYYSEEYIDLSEDLRESFLLEVPVRVLCSEDCEGLCPNCGQNLNEEKCDCRLEPEEPQTSKFADLVKMLEIKGKLEV